MAISKEKILDEIKRTAKENGDRPLGVLRFGKETGIKPYDWQRYWVKFTSAQEEAGFSPNQLNVPYADDFLLEKIILLTRKLGRFPGSREIHIEKVNDPTFPTSSAFNRAFGNKAPFTSKLLAYCADKNGYQDIIELCSNTLESDKNIETDIDDKKTPGSVYIFEHGKYYKIGKTMDTVRRGNELKILLPESLNLIHEIKTDDPSGVETYWHKRFESKRMNGEWFNLNSNDIKAFKRWRRIF